MTPPPQVLIDSAVTFENGTTATLAGRATDAAGVASLEFFQGDKDLGAATLGADGSFSFTHKFGPGFHVGLKAVATDNLGNSTTAHTHFGLRTGIKGSPFASEVDHFTPRGVFSGSAEYTKTGQLYLESVAKILSNGDQLVDYYKGSFLHQQSYLEFTDVSTPDGNLAIETFSNRDLTHDITGYQDGLKINSFASDTITGGGSNETFVFQPHFGHVPHFGQDTITDFRVSGSGHDVVSLPKSEFSSIAEILQNTQQVGHDAVIHVTNYDTITLQNVTKAELEAHTSDFKLHG